MFQTTNWHMCLPYQQIFKDCLVLVLVSPSDMFFFALRYLSTNRNPQRKSQRSFGHTYISCCDMEVSLNGGYPQNHHVFERIFPFEPSILGYPPFQETSKDFDTSPVPWLQPWNHQLVAVYSPIKQSYQSHKI